MSVERLVNDGGAAVARMIIASNLDEGFCNVSAEIASKLVEDLLRHCAEEA